MAQPHGVASIRVPPDPRGSGVLEHHGAVDGRRHIAFAHASALPLVEPLVTAFAALVATILSACRRGADQRLGPADLEAAGGGDREKAR